MKRDPAPTLERVKAYEMVRRLVEEGTERRPAALGARLKEAGLVVPSRMTIVRWIQDATSPASSLRRFDPVPSEELSFFVAAWTGDGWADDSDGGKRLLLKVRSRTFAEEFARSASVILRKTTPYRVRVVTGRNGTWYVVKVTSLRLYDFVTQPLPALRAFTSPHPVGFLRGFFTAEGCPIISVSSSPTKGSISRERLDVTVAVSNCDLELLEYSRDLLLHLGFHPGNSRLNMAKGKRTNLSVATKSNYLVTLARSADVAVFAERVGFADAEKNAKLRESLRLVDTLGPSRAAERWKELYTKVAGKWTRNCSPA